MAAFDSSLATGPLSAGVCSSSSLLSQSNQLATSCHPWSPTSSISGGSIYTSGFRGAKCRTANAESAGPHGSSTLYSLLGLEQGVGLNDIKTSYRKLARQFHPDVCVLEDQEECTKMFLQVQDAYEVLSDPVRRGKYDYQLMNPLGPYSVGWGSMVRRSKESEIATEAWKSAWREQLARFPAKERPADSWAAKMRAKHAASS